MLRGHAVILEFDFKEKGRALKRGKIDGKAHYRKHLLDTAGQGVRDLAFDGDETLVLTGAPLAGDGSASILRWHGAVDCRQSGVHLGPSVSTALTLPCAAADDNPEDLTAWADATWLVVQDSPHFGRVSDESEDYRANIWRLTG